MAKPLKIYLILAALLMLCFLSHSQCQSVCIKGGSVGITGSVVAAGNSTVTQAAGTTFTVQQRAGTTFTTSISSNTTNVTVATTLVSSNGSTTANAYQISFLTSDDFTGTINGAVVGGNVSITMPLINYRTYPSIAYTRTTGSILINEIR